MVRGLVEIFESGLEAHTLRLSGARQFQEDGRSPEAQACLVCVMRSEEAGGAGVSKVKCSK